MAAGVVVVVVLVAVVAVVLGGKSSSGGGGGSASGEKVAGSGTAQIPVGDDSLPNKNIRLQPNVVVIASKGGSVIRSVGADGQSLVLDGSAPGVAGLAPGKVVLLTGVSAFRVQSVAKQGSDVQVTAVAATLPEVVQDGAFSWSGLAVDPAAGVLAASP